MGWQPCITRSACLCMMLHMNDGDHGMLNEPHIWKKNPWIAHRKTWYSSIWMWLKFLEPKIDDWNTKHDPKSVVTTRKDSLSKQFKKKTMQFAHVKDQGVHAEMAQSLNQWLHENASIPPKFQLLNSHLAQSLHRDELQSLSENGHKGALLGCSNSKWLQLFQS